MLITPQADIGHSRRHAEQLTRPWPMGKCAYEGSFSLYEALEDFIQRGQKPTAALIATLKALKKSVF